jgi:RNA polymerase sigma-70 factor (ECF subfamily)
MNTSRRSGSVRDSPELDASVAPASFEATTARLYRDVWGRAVAALTRLLGDLDLAEDVLQEAWVVALERWRHGGVPADPTAWLLTTARNKAVDRLRRARNLRSKEPLLVERDVPGPFEDLSASSITDDRLRLMFTCCHPALSMESRVALTLRTLGGLTTPEIAKAFLVNETAMGQRLSRAKRKIKVAASPTRSHRITHFRSAWPPSSRWSTWSSTRAMRHHPVTPSYGASSATRPSVSGGSSWL